MTNEELIHAIDLAFETTSNLLKKANMPSTAKESDEVKNKLVNLFSGKIKTNINEDYIKVIHALDAYGMRMNYNDDEEGEEKANEAIVAMYRFWVDRHKMVEKLEEYTSPEIGDKVAVLWAGGQGEPSGWSIQTWEQLYKDRPDYFEKVIVIERNIKEDSK